MVSILLWILKIAGILLLSVLGILLLILFLALAVPIRYRAKASFHGKFTAEARVSWLFRFLTLSVIYDEELRYFARILGFQILSSEADAAYEEELEEGPERERNLEPETEPEKQRAEEQTIKKAEPVRRQTEEIPEKPEFHERIPEKPHPAHEPLGHRIIKKIRSFFGRIGRKLKLLAEKRQMILTFLKDEENQKTIRLIFSQVKRLLLHLLPTRVEADVILGFEDPAATGQVLSYLSIPQAFYGDRIQITPVFDRDIKEGDVSVQGRIRLGMIALCGIRILLNRNFRILLKKWRTYGGQ